MSGECGYGRSPFLAGSFTGNSYGTRSSEDVAKLASATLSKLNSMMRQMNDWRDERLALESKVNRLKSALQKLGKNPDEALGPDPLLVHQRSEINRLELTRERLEAEVRGLRESLREADQAITCSGARRLLEKMARVRDEGESERRKLADEIGHLKLRVEEAEEESSCSSLGRLRLKLREILKVDKEMERVIADVASRSCGTVIDLSNELTRIKDLLDESRLENTRLNRERSGLRAQAALDLRRSSSSGCSGRDVKELGDDSGLAKRVEELEEALNESCKKLEAQEALVTSLRNEVIGAKAAYRIKSKELAGLQDSNEELLALKETLKDREKLVKDLQQSLSESQDVGRLRDELSGVKAELLTLEIERDGLADEVEKLEAILSDRNERISQILEESEAREKARSSELEGVRTRLCIACADNERLKLRCVELSENRAGGDDRSALLVRKIKELEEKLAGLERPPNPEEKSSKDSNPEVRTLECQVQTMESMLKEAQSVAEFAEHLSELKTENQALKDELDDLKAKDEENRRKLKSQLTQTAGDDSEEKLVAFEFSVKKLAAERDALKNEYKKVSHLNTGLRAELEGSKAELEALIAANESLKEKMREKLAEFEEALKESKISKAAIEDELEKEKLVRTELEAAVEKLRAEVAAFETERKAGKLLEEAAEPTEGRVMNCGDYVRADRELKYYIHLQSLAVKRVVDFISYLLEDGEDAGSPRPGMAKFLEPTASGAAALNLDENIAGTFRMSLKLSGKIFAAENEVQKLEALKYERNNLRAERDCLNRGLERLSEMLSKIGQEILPPRHMPLPGNHPADFEKPNNEDDGDSTGRNAEGLYFSEIENADQESEFSVINGRIQVLETQIQLKQEEAAERLIEMRETMRQERIQLMEIADRADVPPSREELAYSYRPHSRSHFPN